MIHAAAPPDTLLTTGAAIFTDRDVFQRSFDRTPFDYEHNISSLDLFQLDQLAALAEKYDRDYFVSSGAPTAAARFTSVRMNHHGPREAFDHLDDGNLRILLKNPERYDPRYADLLQTLFRSVVEMRGGLRGQRVVRLAASILITSAATITPFHFDPEISFFFQIAGDKIYHLYAPCVLTELELERFYRMGMVNIGQVALEGRDPVHEYVFHLKSGKGMHQPQNCPHWVQTRASRSISYVFSFETDATRATGRARAFNHYQRKLGLTPSLPGTYPKLDASKSKAMELLFPLQRRMGGLIRKARNSSGSSRGEA